MKRELILKSVVRTSGADGRPVALVHVRGAFNYSLSANPEATSYAVLDGADFDRLVASGYPLTWRLNARSKADRRRSYVRVCLPGRGNRQIAQLVSQAGRGSGISYRDGNPLNLRRSNLVIGEGRSKGDWWPDVPEEFLLPHARKSSIAFHEDEQ